MQECDKIIIWAIQDGRQWRAGNSNSRYSPIPFGAIPIIECLNCDKRFMLSWIQKRLKRRWSIERIKAACGG
ncbi:hypothetical protein HMPREF1006_02470 [Synergistes sp. 3_1_syn1]|jgi:hypothetical protein|nr:hypothetical protein HMPREF1006_02470 [Synergistes sp. 3_1_syn1]